MKTPVSLRSALAGAAGSVAMTTFMDHVAPHFGVAAIDDRALLAPLLGSRRLGELAHYACGTLLFPAVYRRVRGGRSSAAKGVLFGASLWLVSQTVVTPMAGGGFFSGKLGGARFAAASLAEHLVYGALLGAMAE